MRRLDSSRPKQVLHCLQKLGQNDRPDSGAGAGENHRQPKVNGFFAQQRRGDRAFLLEAGHILDAEHIRAPNCSTFGGTRR